VSQGKPERHRPAANAGGQGSQGGAPGPGGPGVAIKRSELRRGRGTHDEAHDRLGCRASTAPASPPHRSPLTARALHRAAFVL